MRTVVLNTIKSIARLATAAALSVVIAHAQSSNGGGGAESYLQRPLGARAVGLAGAYTAIANEPIGLFYNPACLAAFPTMPQFSLMFSPLEFGRTHSAFAYGQAVSEEVGVGVGVNHLYHGSFRARNIQGYDLGEFTNEQFAFAASGAWKSGFFSVGGSLKYLMNTLRGSGSSGTAVTADLGAKADIADLFTVAVAAQNFFGQMDWNNSSVKENLPFTLRGGIAAEIGLDAESYVVRKNVRGETQTIELPAKSYITISLDAVFTQYDNSPLVTFGAEYAPMQQIALRGGIAVMGDRDGKNVAFPMTRWGGGFSVSPNFDSLPFTFQIDYAIAAETIVESSVAHYLSLIVAL